MAMRLLLFLINLIGRWRGILCVSEFGCLFGYMGTETIQYTYIQTHTLISDNILCEYLYNFKKKYHRRYY